MKTILWLNQFWVRTDYNNHSLNSNNKRECRQRNHYYEEIKKILANNSLKNKMKL